MFTSNIMLNDGKTVDTGSIFWSHVFLCFVSVKFVDEVELAGPRSIPQELIQKLALFVPTEVVPPLVPFF